MMPIHSLNKTETPAQLMPDILKKSPEPHQMVPGTSAFYGAHTPANDCQRN